MPASARSWSAQPQRDRTGGLAFQGPEPSVVYQRLSHSLLVHHRGIFSPSREERYCNASWRWSAAGFRAPTGPSAAVAEPAPDASRNAMASLEEAAQAWESVERWPTRETV